MTSHTQQFQGPNTDQLLMYALPHGEWLWPNKETHSDLRAKWIKWGK